MAHRPVSLADCLRALTVLAPEDDRTQAAMLDMMLSRASPRHAKRQESRRSPERVNPDPSAAVSPPADRKTPEPPVPGGQPSYSAEANPTRVTPLERRPIPTTAPLAQPSLAAGGSAPVTEPLQIIDFGKARAVLSTLAATPHAGSAVDISATLVRISRGLPLRRLPRVNVWSVRRGLQLLIDCSSAMTPLAYDVESVSHRLALILGSDRLQRLYFDSCPSRGVWSGESSDRKPWKAPVSGAPVLMLTDLGCAGPRSNSDWASPEEWVRFSDKVREAGNALIALSPFPTRRVPTSLAQSIVVAPWNEDLSAALVRRVLRNVFLKR